ncbi:hypothetical protein BHE74_00003141 [Ensete ventricosum]|nr:hypothetical protein BHE74_00003141 [Ensete ventricosum]
MPAIHNNKLNADASYFLYVFAGGSNFALHIDNHFSGLLHNLCPGCLSICSSELPSTVPSLRSIIALTLHCPAFKKHSAGITFKTQFCALLLDQDLKGFEEKLFERITLVVGYSGSIYTCRAKGCRTEVFNRSDAFGRPADTILRETLLSSISEISFDGVVDCQYDLMNMRCCVKVTYACRGDCRCGLSFPGEPTWSLG